MSRTTHDFLLSLLPRHSVGFDSKEEFKESYRFKKTKTLISKKFIRFNTKSSTTTLIFDVDAFPHFSQKPSLEEFTAFCTIMIGFVPTWVVATDKGYHVALVLKHKVYTKGYKSQKETKYHQALMKLKKEITTLLGADRSGSHRSAGIWRNPLAHQANINEENTYTLQELCKEHHIEIKTQPVTKNLFKYSKNNQSSSLKLKSSSTLYIFIQNGYTKGNRNNYLFAKGYKYLYEHRELTKEQLDQWMQAINNAQATEQLTSLEVSNIATSIYSKKESMYQRAYKPYEPGPLYQEMWERGIHGLKARQQYGQRYSASKKREKTQQLIVAYIKKLDYIPSAKEIAMQIQRSVKTVTHYLKNNSLLFLSLIGEATQKIDIRLNFPRAKTTKTFSQIALPIPTQPSPQRTFTNHYPPPT